MYNQAQRKVKVGGLVDGRQFVARVLLALALGGCIFGFTEVQHPVAAAGYNWFIDPGCSSPQNGSATPGINWYGYAFSSTAWVRTYLYFNTIYGWQVQEQWESPFTTSGSGDLRNYLSGHSNSSGTWQGEVEWHTSFMTPNNGNHTENFWC